MRKLRERITPARWRRIHFGILGTGICLVLLNLGLGALICLGALPLALRRHKLAQRRKMQE